jgi:glycosyltransferase involved in cell wall biosynthesis
MIGVMTSNPRVSVVIIFLNEEKFLRQAIDSVLAQTYTNWELLMVDDGSTDKSTQIAKEYAAADTSRIRYLEHPGHANRGMSASRNHGIAYATGEYLAFLDADDVWLPHKLERHVRLLDRHPDAAMVYGAPVYWYNWTGKIDDYGRDEVPSLLVPTDTPIPPPTLLLTFLAGKAPPPWPSDVVIRHTVAKAVGGFEDIFRGMYEDQAFFSKVLLIYPVVASSECSMKYRQHPDACYLVAKRTGQRDQARVFYLRWLKRYLATQKNIDSEVWRVLRVRLEPYRVSHVLRVRGRRLLKESASTVRSLAGRAWTALTRSVTHQG